MKIKMLRMSIEILFVHKKVHIFKSLQLFKKENPELKILGKYQIDRLKKNGINNMLTVGFLIFFEQTSTLC